MSKIKIIGNLISYNTNTATSIGETYIIIIDNFNRIFELLYHYFIHIA